MKNSIPAAVVVAAVLAATSAIANDAHHRLASAGEPEAFPLLAQAAPTAQAPAATLADGEVRRVDREQGKVTIKHGEIRNLEMPPMTMVFRAKDPSMLDRLKQGDKIRFTAEQVNGAYTVTRIEPAK